MKKCKYLVPVETSDMKTAVLVLLDASLNPRRDLSRWINAPDSALGQSGICGAITIRSQEVHDERAPEVSDGM